MVLKLLQTDADPIYLFLKRIPTNTVTLIYGERDAGKNLVTIYITHAHYDQWASAKAAKPTS